MKEYVIRNTFHVIVACIFYLCYIVVNIGLG